MGSFEQIKNKNVNTDRKEQFIIGSLFVLNLQTTSGLKRLMQTV